MSAVGAVWAVVIGRKGAGLKQVRQCAQQIIAAHVVAKDYPLRDRLIEEYVDQHGSELLRCVFDFVHSHIVQGVEPEIAEARFHFILTHLGNLIELVAERTEVQASDLVVTLSSLTFDEASYTEASEKALRAAQTCLLVHMLVRQGMRPWGVQKRLRLPDMCAVVDLLGDLMWTLVTVSRDDLGDVALVRGLLSGVERILKGMAHAHGLSVSELVADYWGHLSLHDCG